MRTMLRGPFSGAVIHQLDQLFDHGTAVGLSEGELLERFVGARDESAFEALIARHGPMVLGVCRRLLRDPHDVDDAFQATFLVLVRRAGSLRRRDLLGNWLYGVAHRVAKRSRMLAARRLARAPYGSDVVGQVDDARDQRDGPTSPALDPEPAPWLHEEVRRLPEKYRAPVLLCYFEGLTHEQAAARLGWPVGTVKGRLARARDLLRKRLTRRGVTLSAAAIASHLELPHARAAVPESLRYATVKAAHAAVVSAASSLVAGSAVSLPVAVLADGVLKAMIITHARAVAIPMLIAGIVTTGALVGAAQYAESGGPPAATAKARTQAGNAREKTSPPQKIQSTPEKGPGGVLEPGPRDAEVQALEAAQARQLLLAEELGADRNMFNYLSSLHRDVRADDMRKLIALSRRMLAIDLRISDNYRSRLDAYQGHRERLGRLYQYTQQDAVPKHPEDNQAMRNLLETLMKEMEDRIAEEMMKGPAVIPEEMMKGPEGAASEAGAKAVATQVSATPKPADSGSNDVATGVPAAPKPAEATADPAPAGGSAAATITTKARRSGAGGAWQDPTAEFQNRLTIAQLSAVLAASDKNPADDAVLRKLDQPLTLSFAGPTPLKDVLAHIKTSLAEPGREAIPIYVDPNGLEQAGTTLEDPVRIDLKNVPLKTGLRLVLKQMGLAYCVRDGVLIVSSVEGVREELAEAARELLGSGNEHINMQMMNQMGIGGGGGMR